jgi:acylphosphatase
MTTVGHDNHTVRLVISGRVQGVFFRATAQETAQELGLTGWVRNRQDGTVEVTATGPRQRLEKLIAWCHHGPPAAAVSAVAVNWQPVVETFAGFIIR